MTCLFKYFLQMAPEEPVIDPSSLTKFRKLRLKDLNLPDMLIGKTVKLAIEKGVPNSSSIIVDATHTKARYNQKSPREILQDQSRKLRKAIYSVDEKFKTKLPAKNNVDTVEAEIIYCQQLIEVTKVKLGIAQLPKITEPLNLLQETVEDDVEQLRISKDQEGCYTEGCKTKTYSVTIKSNEHTEQMAFQESEYFKEKSKERYKIEAKNSKLKHRHGYDVTTSIGMELQGAMAIFAVNLKRILKLTD